MMKAKYIYTKEHRGYITPTCTIMMVTEEPMMAGSGNDEPPTELEYPDEDEEVTDPNQAKWFNHTSVWDEY